MSKKITLGLLFSAFLVSGILVYFPANAEKVIFWGNLMQNLKINEAEKKSERNEFLYNAEFLQKKIETVEQKSQFSTLMDRPAACQEAFVKYFSLKTALEKKEDSCGKVTKLWKEEDKFRFLRQKLFEDANRAPNTQCTEFMNQLGEDYEEERADVKELMQYYNDICHSDSRNIETLKNDLDQATQTACSNCNNDWPMKSETSPCP